MHQSAQDQIPVLADELISRVDANCQERLNASTGAEEPGATECINRVMEPRVPVEGGGREQTNASTEPGANKCIDRTSPSTIGLGLLVANSAVFWSNAFAPTQFQGWWEGF